MKTTDKLKLKQPGYEDPVDIEELNENMDIIEGEFISMEKGIVIGKEAPNHEVTKIWIDTN